MNARMMSAYMYCIYRFTMEVHFMKNYVMFGRDIAQCVQSAYKGSGKLGCHGSVRLCYLCVFTHKGVKVHCNKVLYVGDAKSKLYT